MLFLAKDEYTFTFLKGSTKSPGGGTTKTKAQAGDASLKNLLRSLEKIFRRGAIDSSDKLSKSLEAILLKFAKAQTQVKGVAASAGLSGPEARRIAKEIASEIVNQQIKQLTKAYPSKTTTTQSNDKLIKSIERSSDRQAKTIVAGLNSILSSKGIQLEDTVALERAISGAVQSAIPKDTGVGIKEIGKIVVLLKSGIGDINKIVKNISSMRKSEGGIDVKEIKEMMKSFQELNQKYKQISDSTTKAGKAIKSVTNDVVEFKKSLSEVKQVAAGKVRGVRQRAEEDPGKFAKTAAVAIGQTLEKALKQSPSFKGSELESNVKKLSDGVKDVGDLLNKFKKIQGDIQTLVQKGKISVDTKVIGDLSKDLEKLPKTIGIDVNTKGWKDLTTGLEGFAKTADIIIKSLKELKVSVAVDTKPIEKKVEDAVKKGLEKGFSGNIKTLMKEADTSFNKVISEMRTMYSTLPKESPLRPRFEQAGKALRAAKEKGDYPEIARRVGGMQDVVKAPVLNKAIEQLKGSIVEMTSELKGAGIDDVADAFKKIKSGVNASDLDKKLKKTGKAVDGLASAADKKSKEISRFNLENMTPARVRDQVKFLQSTTREFPQKIIEPGKSFELKGTEIGYGSNVRKAVKEKADSLAVSLKNLEKDLIDGLEKGTNFKQYGWELLDKELKNVGQQWTLQIAKIGEKGGIESLLKGLDKSYVKIEDPKKLIQAYESKRKSNIADITKQDTEKADKIGKWLVQRDENEIEELTSTGSISRTTKDALKEVKSKHKGTEVGTAMRKELVDRLGSSLNDVFKETFAAAQVKKELTSGDFPLVKRLAIPAAQISKTGTAIFKTRHGTERALPKFATYKTGFEELYDRMAEQKAVAGEEAIKLQEDIINIGMKPDVGKLKLAKGTSRKMLSKIAPNQMDFILEQYKEAATMVGAKRQQSGVGSVSGYEKKISTGIEEFKKGNADLPVVFNEFMDYMEELGISAYDVVKSLESIKFENVYDVYRKILKTSPLKKIAASPDLPSSLRGFDKAVAQVEQLMPIIEKS